MSEIQDAKTAIRSYMAAFDASPPETRLDVLHAHATPDYRWRGMHPFHEQSSATNAVAAFWTPLLAAFSALQRREDIFLAGYNDCDGGETIWTCSMGHILGLFDHDWLGIPATRKIVQLPYVEFHRVEGDKIAETALFCDILRVAAQAGLSPLPPQTGADLPNPGPLTNDGQLLSEQEPETGAATLALVNHMAADITAANAILQGASNAKPLTPEQELSRRWHDDMAWYGPTGIGATYTIERYIEQHQQPFRRQLSDRQFHGHIARIAEGNYCAFFGWPNLHVTPTGGYLGLPGTNIPAPMRVVDVYRRAGDKLAENWVFIDLLHFLNMQGLDVLSRLDVR